MERIQRNKLYVVMYHYTRDLKNSRYPKIQGMDLSLFSQQLDYFIENFNIVTMEQVIEAWNSSNGNLPEKALLLTFDDGYIDNYLVALPQLMERHIQGSFFIPGKTFTENTLLDVNKIHFILANSEINQLIGRLFTKLDFYRGSEFDYPANDVLFKEYAVANRFDCKEVIFVKRILQNVLPERLRQLVSSELFEESIGLPEHIFARELYMNSNQITLMKNEGMYIGIHGYDHYWLGNLPEEKMKEDIDKALEVMTSFIDQKGWVMNYPYGSYNDSVLSYIEAKGCKLGLTTNVHIAEIGRDNRLILPRLDCNDFPPKSDNYIVQGEQL